MPPLDWVQPALDDLQQQQLLRDLPAPLPRAAPTGPDGLVNFASNDYLGLAGHPGLAQAAAEACRQHGVGRGASPLICGRSLLHEQLERQLASFFNEEATLLFPTGFATNAGIIPALVDRGDAIFADAKNHASLIDGCRLAHADCHVYPHNDTSSLATLLEGAAHYRRRLIVTDTLFSMDGDLAPLPQIAKLAQQHHAMLMLDEAHAVGVFGSTTHPGRGVAEHFAATADLDLAAISLRVGTLSKAFGSAGGFVVGSESLIRWLANRARSYVFSTAHPAANAAAALAALELLQEQPTLGASLLATAAELRQQLADRGWNVGSSASQVIPLRVGSAEQALALSAALAKRGHWVPAIRPPSVPAGESLLRLSLTTAHPPQMIAGLLAALDQTSAAETSKTPAAPAYPPC